VYELPHKPSSYLPSTMAYKEAVISLSITSIMEAKVFTRTWLLANLLPSAEDPPFFFDFFTSSFFLFQQSGLMCLFF
jgi:hypothetical protein